MPTSRRRRVVIPTPGLAPRTNHRRPQRHVRPLVEVAQENLRSLGGEVAWPHAIDAARGAVVAPARFSPALAGAAPQGAPRPRPGARHGAVHRGRLLAAP